jgi:chemotaxis protein MotA
MITAGYLWEGGNLSLLYQPAELVIIGGAALGAMMIASSPKVLKSVLEGVKSHVSHKPYESKDYVEVLLVANSMFEQIKKEGLRSIEGDLDKPQKSKLFKKFPRFSQNKHALNLLADAFRIISITKLSGHQMEALLEADIETYHEEMMVSSKSISNLADSLPALGIVAAVLGIVITMTKINESPEVLGHSIGAAMVGTFLGVLLAYGFVGPVAKKLESIADEEKEYLNILKTIIVCFVSGVHPKLAVEFGRILIPDKERPAFLDMEKRLRKANKAPAG